MIYGFVQSHQMVFNYFRRIKGILPLAIVDVPDTSERRPLLYGSVRKVAEMREHIIY